MTLYDEFERDIIMPVRCVLYVCHSSDSRRFSYHIPFLKKKWKSNFDPSFFQE